MDGAVVALTHVIAYDISDDRRRARVAAILQTYGDRVQRSVFVCAIEAGLLAEARERISEIIDPETDSVYVFRQCAAMLGSNRHPRPGQRGRRGAVLGGAVGGGR
jgi:CRISPR-associated protein Cas2